MPGEETGGSSAVPLDKIEVIEEIRISDPEVVKKIREAKEQGLEGSVTIAW